MSECWHNVYLMPSGVTWVGTCKSSRAICDDYWRGIAAGRDGTKLLYRIHVIPKR